jgi:Ecdysteroid kinase-like family
MTAVVGGDGPGVVDAADQLTPAWFDAVLGTGGTRSAIRRVTTEPVGTGQMATTARVHLELGDGTDRTVIAKYGRPDVAAQLARVAYAKEVAFYGELSARLAVRTPDCLYAAIADGPAPRFVLVLEDLSDARQGDQIEGCTPEQAAAAVVNLAGLHGPTWCDADLAGAEWLSGGDDAAISELLAPFLAMAADVFTERFGADLDDVEQAVLADARELIVPWLTDRGERFAVTHGDYRLDNLLFPPDDPERVAAVDWQTTALGPPGRDLAYFLSTCLPVDDRRRHETDLVATYHRALGDHDVTGYAPEDCWEDYRLGMFHAPFIILLSQVTVTSTPRGDAMFRAMWQRAAAAIADLDSTALVRDRIAARG